MASYYHQFLYIFICIINIYVAFSTFTRYGDIRLYKYNKDKYQFGPGLNYTHYPYYSKFETLK